LQATGHSQFEFLRYASSRRLVAHLLRRFPAPRDGPIARKAKCILIRR